MLSRKKGHLSAVKRLTRIDSFMKNTKLGKIAEASAKVMPVSQNFVQEQKRKEK
jgi:hypothetical protein